MGVNSEFWRGRRVFVTGHTGFKGAWLSIWLKSLGAEVFGFSTEPPTSPNLFTIAEISKDLTSHIIGDIRDIAALGKAIHAAAPEIVFHMAAQSLVRNSYLQPVETYATNVLGTVNLFEVVRNCRAVKVIINITSDKCYENKEWLWGYRETDRVGGRDPYSNSKACSELVTAAYRSSFFLPQDTAIATARAGNVVGGGDWAADRLVPDFFRALAEKKTLLVRNPFAARPWQHVLEPLSGYLCLAEKMWERPLEFSEAWNFGPSNESLRHVNWILDYLCTQIPSAHWRHESCEGLHEANLLKIDSSKARLQLGWFDAWNIETTLDYTIEWYLKWLRGECMREVCLEHIKKHELSSAE